MTMVCWEHKEETVCSYMTVEDLNTHGKEGWEVVMSYRPNPDEDYIFYVFKRPLAPKIEDLVREVQCAVHGHWYKSGKYCPVCLDNATTPH